MKMICSSPVKKLRSLSASILCIVSNGKRTHWASVDVLEPAQQTHLKVVKANCTVVAPRNYHVVDHINIANCSIVAEANDFDLCERVALLEMLWF